MGDLFPAINNGLDWSYGVKLILIVAAAVLLCVVAILLVAEIVGKRKRRVIHENAEPQITEETVEKVEEEPEVVEEAVEEPKAEEAAPEPEIIEEVAAAESEPVEEYKIDEEIELTENAQLVDDGEEEGHVLVGTMQFKVRYDRSFTAKLIQADDVLKGRYSELKNELMRYSLKPRISWTNESFYKGRVTYAKFAIRGKTLSLYLALEPSEYADTKYKFEDSSEVVKYAKTPMRLKLKSDRSVRWAKELIAQLAAKFGLEQIEKEEEDFRPEYEETKPLVERKLIKLYYAGERIYTHPETEGKPPVAETVEEVEVQPVIEEVAVEEPIVEEVTEEPVIEEIGEEVTEEIAVTETQPITEHKIDEEIELVENAQLLDDGEDRGVVVVGENQFEVRYNRSFTAKLIQSDDVLKGRYSELKNELMRYSLKPRISWTNESFYKGRVTYAKFAIRGKTLSLYLALDPSEYTDTKYKFEDSSEVAKYAKTPMRLKLRSDRSVRWAKELIAQLAAKYGLEQTEKSEENFRPEYEETTPLAERKLIKLYYAGEHIYPHPDAEQKDVQLVVEEPVSEPVPEEPVEKLIEEVTEEVATEVAAEEPEPVEGTVEENTEEVAEESVGDLPVEESEAIEEIAIAELEEEPEPVEGTVEENTEEVAEESVGESVEEQPEPEQEIEEERVEEVVKASEQPYRQKKKSKPSSNNCKIISTGKLNASFEDGEEVTLSKLKEKNIFPKNIRYYKVLFGGEVTKALTVVANEFSGEAKGAIENAGGSAIKI